MQGLLDGHTLEQLEAQRDRANADAGELATDIEADQVAEMRRRPNLDTELRTARVEHRPRSATRAVLMEKYIRSGPASPMWPKRKRL